MITGKVTLLKDHNLTGLSPFQFQNFIDGSTQTHPREEPERILRWTNILQGEHKALVLAAVYELICWDTLCLDRINRLKERSLFARAGPSYYDAIPHVIT